MVLLEELARRVVEEEALGVFVQDIYIYTYIHIYIYTYIYIYIWGVGFTV